MNIKPVVHLLLPRSLRICFHAPPSLYYMHGTSTSTVPYGADLSYCQYVTDSIVFRNVTCFNLLLTMFQGIVQGILWDISCHGVLGWYQADRQLAGSLFLSGGLFLHLCPGTKGTAVPNVD